MSRNNHKLFLPVTKKGPTLLVSWTLVETQTGRGSASRSGGAGVRQPSYHHKFGGSSATLLLNKVISSRCTMGTSRMTSVRPSWSRGKMTTFNAGLSAWKLNQRPAINGAVWVEDAAQKGKGSGSHRRPWVQSPAHMFLST